MLGCPEVLARVLLESGFNRSMKKKTQERVTMLENREAIEM